MASIFFNFFSINFLSCKNSRILHSIYIHDLRPFLRVKIGHIQESEYSHTANIKPTEDRNKINDWRPTGFLWLFSKLLIDCMKHIDFFEYVVCSSYVLFFRMFSFCSFKWEHCIKRDHKLWGIVNVITKEGIGLYIKILFCDHKLKSVTL